MNINENVSKIQHKNNYHNILKPQNKTTNSLIDYLWNDIVNML